MARCTAPVRGHSSAAAAAACPVCRYRSSSRYGGGYSSSYYPSTTSSSYSSSSGGSSGRGSSRKSSKPRWSSAGSAVFYTPQEVQSLTPIRESVEAEAIRHPDRRDVFLCHAWDDRQGAAKQLHDFLEAAGVKVWCRRAELADPLCAERINPHPRGLSRQKNAHISVGNFLSDEASRQIMFYWQICNSCFPSQ